MRELKGRIRSIVKIRDVTRAMKTASAGKYRKAVALLADGRLYVRRIEEAAARLGCSEPAHPAAAPRGGKPLLVLISSDRGLCGGFNSRLIDALDEYIAAHPGCDVRLTVMGKVIARRAQRYGWRIEQQHSQPVRPTEGGGRRDARFWEAPVHALTERAVTGYLQGEYDQVDVLYAHFTSGIEQTPTVARLLPLRREPGRADPRRRLLAEAGFEPDPAALIARLVPEHLRWVVANAFLNSIGSENAARQMAMARATENAGEMLTELRLTFSRMRQESITGEMIELSRGAEPADAPAGASRAG